MAPYSHFLFLRRLTGHQHPGSKAGQKKTASPEVPVPPGLPVPEGARLAARAAGAAGAPSSQPPPPAPRIGRTADARERSQPGSSVRVLRACCGHTGWHRGGLSWTVDGQTDPWGIRRLHIWRNGLGTFFFWRALPLGCYSSFQTPSPISSFKYTKLGAPRWFSGLSVCVCLRS